MKTLILFITMALFSSFSLAHIGHSHDKPSVHGMLMVGKSKIYLSHLPMFHSPHDYQVIFEVKIDAASLTKYIASLESSSESVYTLVPQVFVLPDMMAHPQPFKAQIYKGHFERGGELIADTVTVFPSVIQYSKKFDPASPQPQNGSYILFGNQKEVFMAHQITAKPDFDQITKVTVDSALQTRIIAQGKVQVMTTTSNAEPIANGTHSVTSTEGNHEIQINSQVYLETGDLSF